MINFTRLQRDCGGLWSILHLKVFIGTYSWVNQVSLLSVITTFPPKNQPHFPSILFLVYQNTQLLRSQFKNLEYFDEFFNLLVFKVAVFHTTALFLSWALQVC